MDISNQDNWLEKLNNTDWDLWLSNIETKLKELGYRKYNQKIKSEDFAYWKTMQGYMVGVFFYDFRKYKHNDPYSNRIGLQYECMLINIDGRCDLSISRDDTTIEIFETISKHFYESMISFCDVHKNNE